MNFIRDMHDMNGALGEDDLSMVTLRFSMSNSIGCRDIPC